jgi:dienelactone hydrolase
MAISRSRLQNASGRSPALETADRRDYHLRMRLAALLLVLTAWLVPARAGTVQFTGGGGAPINADFVLPPGPAVAPAVVLLHGCGGPFPSRDRQWVRVLTAAGHPVLLPDSFGSRGLGSQCRVRAADRTVTAAGLRRDDAIAAARWLAAQPGTPPGGVAVMGWSDGGSTTLGVALHEAGEPPGFIRGFVAFYPGCRWSDPNPAGPPILVLIGEADDWTPAAPCRALALRLDSRITLVTYPGAYHDFDAPGRIRLMGDIPSSRNADLSVHAGQNPAARADALVRVPAFLAGLPAAP